jgi:hypothetical protein
MPDLTHSLQPDSSSESPSTGRWLVKLPGAASFDQLVDRLAELNADLMREGWPSRRRRVMVAVARVAVTFCIGVAVTLLWQPYGDAARMMIASATPQLGWLAPPQVSPGLAVASANLRQRDIARPSELEAVRERIDRIAVSQEQITRTVAQLTESQVRIAEEIAKIREIEQYLVYKTSYKAAETPPPQPVVAPARKPARRPSSLR